MGPTLLPKAWEQRCLEKRYGRYCRMNLKMFHLFKFLKINWRNFNQQSIHVGFVRHKFSRSALSKLASYENSFWNPLRKKEKITCLKILLELKTLLEHIPPKKSLRYFLIIYCKNLLNDHCVFIYLLVRFLN